MAAITSSVLATLELEFGRDFRVKLHWRNTMERDHQTVLLLITVLEFHCDEQKLFLKVGQLSGPKELNPVTPVF